jgi:hypothetical protein
MLKKSFYSMSFLCLSLSANLPADDQQYKVEDQLQQRKIDDAKVEQQREEKFRDNARDEERRRLQREQDKRERSDNNGYSSKHLLADKDDDKDRDHGNERDHNNRDNNQPKMQDGQKRDQQIQKNPALDRNVQENQQAPKINQDMQRRNEQQIQKAPVLDRNVQDNQQAPKINQDMQRRDGQQMQKAPVLDRNVQDNQQAPRINQDMQRRDGQQIQKGQVSDWRERLDRKDNDHKGDWQDRMNRRDNRFSDNQRQIQPITKENFDRKAQIWSNKARMQREDFRDYRHQRHVFDNDYWNHYYGRENHWRFNNNFNWWGVSTPIVINDWLHYSTRTPRYYYYGDDGVVYYSDNRSYNNFNEVQGYNNFVNQAVTIVKNIPQVNPANVQWQPLGVFSLVQDYGADDKPNDYFTLAISKEGIVGGVYLNPDTYQNEEIEGIVDAQSQRAVWKFIGKDWPIFETGIYNLTEDQSTAFIHYSNGRTDSQLLIRLQE